MEGAVNGEGEKGGQPPPSPLTGCYLLIVIGEPRSTQHKDIILQRIAKGLLSWDVNECLVDLEKELAVITEQALEGEEARYGERLIQFASENLVTEILIHPVVSTLQQCMRNLLSSFTRHRHIIHSGYTFAANGSWALQDGTFSLADFSEAFQEIDVQRVIRAYENGIGVDLHCSPEGDWTRLPKESFAKACKLRINPTDVLNSGSSAITGFVNYLDQFLVPTTLECLLESTDVVGNIRFSRPTLYVFPGGQGDAALFGISGFNMLLDGGYARKACFWDFVRHLDRLDAVLMTRLNNSNVGGISSVLRRKRQDALYPQIGHFFCNLQERKALLSPDGDKDKDPLLINLLEEGQEIISNLRQLSLNPQVCYRDSEPINLYHKVGHGTLDMYVLSPARDSREVKEFLQKWNQSDQKLFANAKSSREFTFPIQNLVSIAALLVWQPANPNDTITRILIPGSCPQKKIFEGLERLKHLEFLKHPVCTQKSLMPVSVPKKTVRESIIEKVIPTKEKLAVEKKENKLIEDGIIPNGDVIKEKIVKKSDSTESERSTKVKKLEETKIIENGDKPEKPKIRQKPPKGRSESQQRRKLLEKKISPTTPKKTEADDVKEKDAKKPTKPSPISTPAKSTKDATNRRVIESKIKKELPATKPLPPVPKEEPKPKFERKPISRRPKAMKAPISPVKKLVNGVQKPDSISRRGKLDKEGTTDSSTVSTPSADQDNILKKDISKLTPEEIQQLKAQELADLKEEQDAVKEIEAVFRKGETKKVDDPNIRVVKDVSIEEKFEKDEYLIIEKEEIEHDSLDDRDGKEGEMQKLARDSEESEKQRKLSDEDVLKRDVIQEQVEEIVEKAEEVVQAKEEPSKAHSPEEKSTDKKEVEEEKDVVESQPEEKVSVIKSGDTTTAPTLPEDERIPLDEIKEDSGAVIEEKYVKEETKEKELPIIQLPPKTFETVGKLPTVAGIRLDKQTHIRDIVKTPDEVADLPVHEEADLEYIKPETKTNEVTEEPKVGASDKEHLKEVEPEKDKDDVAQDIKEKRDIVREELKTLTDTVLQNELALEKDILEKSVSKLDDKEKTEGVLEKAEVETKEKEVTDEAKLEPAKESPDLKETAEPITSELGLKAEEAIMAVKDEVLTKDKDLDLDKEVVAKADEGKPETTATEDKAKSKSPSPTEEKPTQDERKESKDLDAAEHDAVKDVTKRKTPSPTEDKPGHPEADKKMEKLGKSKSPSPTNDALAHIDVAKDLTSDKLEVKREEPALSEKVAKIKSPSPTKELPIESKLEAKMLPAPVDKDALKTKSSSPTQGKLEELDQLEPKLEKQKGVTQDFKDLSPSQLKSEPRKSVDLDKKEDIKGKTPSPTTGDRKLSKDLGLGERGVEQKEPRKSVDLDEKQDIKEELKSKTPSPTTADRKLSKDLGLSDVVHKEPRKSVDLDTKQDTKEQLKSKTPSPTPEYRQLSKDLDLSEVVHKEPRKSVDLDKQQDTKEEVKIKTPSPTPEDRKLSKDLGLSDVVHKEPRTSVDLEKRDTKDELKSKTPSPTTADRKLSKDLGLSDVVHKEPRKSVDLDTKQDAKEELKSKTPSPTTGDRKLSKDLSLGELGVEQKEPRKSVDLDEKQDIKEKLKSKTPSPTTADRKLSKDLGLSDVVHKEPRKSVDLDTKQDAKEELKSKTPSPTPEYRKLSKDLGLSELGAGHKEPRKSVDLDKKQDIKEELKSKTPSPTTADRKLSKDLGLSDVVHKEPRKSVDLDKRDTKEELKSKTPSPTAADRKLSKDLSLSDVVHKEPRKSVDLDTKQDAKEELKSKTPSPTPEYRKLSKDLGLSELGAGHKETRKSVDLDKKPDIIEELKSKTPSPTTADRKLSKDLGLSDVVHKEPRKSVDLDKRDTKEELKSKTPSPTPEDRNLSKNLGLSELGAGHKEPRRSVDLDKTQDTEEEPKSKTASPTPGARKLDLDPSDIIHKEPRKSVDLDKQQDTKEELKSKTPSPTPEDRRLSKDLGLSEQDVAHKEPRKSVDLDTKAKDKEEIKSKTPSPTPEDRKLSKDLGLSELDVVHKEPRKSLDSDKKQDIKEELKSKTPSPTPADRKFSKDLGLSELDDVHKEPRKSVDLDKQQDTKEELKSKTPSPTPVDRKLSKDLEVSELDLAHKKPRKSVDSDKDELKSKTPSPTPGDRKLSNGLGLIEGDVAHKEPRRSVDLGTNQDVKEEIKSKTPSPTPEDRKLSKDLGVSEIDIAQKEPRKSVDLITKQDVKEAKSKTPSPTRDGRKLSADLGLSKVDLAHKKPEDITSASKISSPTEERAVKSKSSSPTKLLFDELKDVKDLDMASKEDESKLSVKSKSPSPTKDVTSKVVDLKLKEEELKPEPTDEIKEMLPLEKTTIKGLSSEKLDAKASEHPELETIKSKSPSPTKVPTTPTDKEAKESKDLPPEEDTEQFDDETIKDIKSKTQSPTKGPLIQTEEGKETKKPSLGELDVDSKDFKDITDKSKSPSSTKEQEIKSKSPSPTKEILQHDVIKDSKVLTPSKLDVESKDGLQHLQEDTELIKSSSPTKEKLDDTIEDATHADIKPKLVEELEEKEDQLGSKSSSPTKESVTPMHKEGKDAPGQTTTPTKEKEIKDIKEASLSDAKIKPTDLKEDIHDKPTTPSPTKDVPAQEKEEKDPEKLKTDEIVKSKSPSPTGEKIDEDKGAVQLKSEPGDKLDIKDTKGQSPSPTKENITHEEKPTDTMASTPSKLDVEGDDIEAEVGTDKSKSPSPTKDKIEDALKEPKDTSSIKEEIKPKILERTDGSKSPSSTKKEIDTSKDVKSKSPSPTKDTLVQFKDLPPSTLDIEPTKVEATLSEKSKTPSPDKGKIEDTIKEHDDKVETYPQKAKDSDVKREVKEAVKSPSPMKGVELTESKELTSSKLDFETTEVKSKSPSPTKGKIDEIAKPKVMGKKLSQSETEPEVEAEEEGVKEIAKPEIATPSEKPPIQKGKEVEKFTDSQSKLESEPRKSVDLGQKQDIQQEIKSKSPSPPPEGRKLSKGLELEHKPESKTPKSKSPSPTHEKLDDLKTPKVPDTSKLETKLTKPDELELKHDVQEEVRSKTPSPTPHVTFKEQESPKDLKHDAKTPSPIKETDPGKSEAKLEGTKDLDEKRKSLSPELKEQIDSARVESLTPLEHSKELEEKQKVKSRSPTPPGDVTVQDGKPKEEKAKDLKEAAPLSPTDLGKGAAPDKVVSIEEIKKIPEAETLKSKSPSPTKDLTVQKEEMSTKLEDIDKDIDSSKLPSKEVKTLTATTTDKPLDVHVQDAKEVTKSKSPSPEPKSKSPSPSGERKIEEKPLEAKLEAKSDLTDKPPHDEFEDSRDLDETVDDFANKTEVVVIKETELPSVESIKTEIDKIDKEFIQSSKDTKEELIMIEERLQQLKQDRQFTESDVKVVEVKSEDPSPIQEKPSDIDVALEGKITVTEKEADKEVPISKPTGVDAKVSEEPKEKEPLGSEVKVEDIKHQRDNKSDASPQKEITSETIHKKTSPEKELEAEVGKLDTKHDEKLSVDKSEPQTEKKDMSPEKEIVKPYDEADTKESKDEVVEKKSPIQEIIDTIDQLEKTEQELKGKEHEIKDDKQPKLEEKDAKLPTKVEEKELESSSTDKPEIKEKDKGHTKLDTEKEKIGQSIEKATTRDIDTEEDKSDIESPTKVHDDAKTKSEKLGAKEDTDESKAVIKDLVDDQKEQPEVSKQDEKLQKGTDEKSLAEEIKDAKAKVEEEKDVKGDSVSVKDRVEKPQDEAAKVKSKVEDTPPVETDTKLDESKEGALVPEQIRKKPSISIDDCSEELEEIHKKIKDDKIIDKVELGRKSPKEREEDVIKIVATVAEVLKSDAPLEEFEGKLPITTFTSPYTTELRETHITTMDSPTLESKVIKSDSIHTIEEEPHSIISQFLEEEKKESSKHLDEVDDKRSALIKQSQELMMATSKIISDIKSAKPEDKLQDEDAGTVHRMLVTASSEDGGEETEICPPGSITFSKSSESSGRSSPEQSQKLSQKSSLMETISDSLSTVKHVLDMASERDSGIDDAKSEADIDKSRTSPELAKEVSRKVGEVSEKSSPDKDVSDISESKETSSYEDLKRFDDTSKKDSGLSDSEKGSEEFERKGSVIEAIEETIIDGLTKATDFTKSLFGDKDEKDVAEKEITGKTVSHSIEKKTEETKAVTEKINDISPPKEEVEDKKPISTQELDVISIDKTTGDLAETKVEKPTEKTSEIVSKVDKIEKLDTDVKGTIKAVVDKTDEKPQEAIEIVDGALQKMEETVRIKRSAVEMEIKHVIDAAGDDLTKTATKVIDDLKDKQEAVTEKTKEIKDQLSEDKIKAEIDHTSEIVTDTLEKMEEDIKIETSAVQLEMKGIADNAKDSIKEKTENAKDQILKSVEDKTKEIKTDVDLTKEAFTDLSDTIMDKKTTFEQSLDKVQKIEDSFKDDVKDTQDKVGDISRAAEDKICELTSDASQKGKDAILTTTEEMNKDIEDAKHKIDDLAKKAGEEVAEVKGGILSSFGAFLGKAGDMFKSAEESTKDTIDKASNDIEVLKHDTKEEIEKLKDVSDQTKQSIEDEIIEVQKDVKDAMKSVKEKQEETDIALSKDVLKPIEEPETEKIESKGIFGTLLEKAGGIFKATDDAIQGASDQIVKDAGDMTEKASKNLSDIKDGLIQDVSKSLGKAEDILNLKKDQLKDEIAHSKEVVSEQLESIEKAAQEKKEEVAAGLTKAEDELKSKTGQLKEDAVGVQEFIGEKLETLGKEAQEKKKDVAKELEEAKDVLKSKKEKLQEDITDAKDFMHKKLESVGTEVEKMKEETVTDLDKTKDELKTTKEVIKEDAIQAKEIVDEKLKEIGKEVQEKKEELQEDVKHAAGVVGDKVEVKTGLHEKKEEFKDDIAHAKDFVSKELETVGKGVQDKKEEFKEDITHAKEVEGETLQEIEKDVQQKKDEVISDFKHTTDALKSAKEDIKDDATRVEEVVGKKVETVGKTVQDTEEKLADTLKEAHEEAKTAGDDLAKKVDEAAVKAATEIKSGLEKLEKGIEAEKSSVKDGIDRVKTAAKEEVEIVTEKISDVKQSIADATEKEIKEKEDMMTKALKEAGSKIDLTIDESKKGLEESLEKVSAMQQAILESVDGAKKHLDDLTEDVKIKISTSKDAADEKLETTLTQLQQETKTKIDEATKHTEQKVAEAKGGIMGAVGSFLGKAGDLFKSSPDSTKEEKPAQLNVDETLKELVADAEHAKGTVVESIETVIKEIKKEEDGIKELSEGELKIATDFAAEKTEAVKETIKETAESTLGSKEKSEREAAEEFLAESLSALPEPKLEGAMEVSFKETTADKIGVSDSKRTKRSVEDVKITDEAAKELINRFCEDPCEVQKPSKETEAVLKSLEVSSYKPVCEPECVKVCVERKHSDVSAEDFQKISPDQYDDALSSLGEKEKIDSKTDEKPTKRAEDTQGTPTPEDTVIVCISEKPVELTTVTTTSATPSEEKSATVQIITTTITTDTIIPGDKLLSEREQMDEKEEHQIEELDATFDAIEDMIKTAPFKPTASKAGKVLEESAKDLEQTFEVVGDMSRSVVFEKCDRKDSLPITEKLIEKSAQDVSETFETVNEMSKSLVFDKCPSDKTDSEKEVFDEKADKGKASKEVTYEILDNRSSEQAEHSKSSVFEKCERETMEKGSGKSCIVRESRIIISGSSLPPSHDIIQQLKYVDSNLIEDEFTLSAPESQGKKVSISEVDITVPKSEMCLKEVSSKLLETERMSVEKYEQKTEIKEKSASDTTVSIRKTISVSIAGPSSTTSTVNSIGDGKKQEEALLHEKHIPGAVTPPTVPVSPNLQEGKTDISKSQESVCSDEDDRLSTTSEAAHSRESSYYDFDAYVDGKKVDPMSMSFYGALPSGDVEPSYLYEITKAKFSSISTEESDVDVQTVIESKDDVMSSSCIGELPGDEKPEASSGHQEDPIGSWGKPLGLPSTPRSHLYEITKAKYTSQMVRRESRDPSQRFDMMTASVYGDLPVEDSEKAQDPIKSWGKPLGLPSPAPPNDNKGTPKKERKLPPNVTAKNKLNDDKRRADSPSKHNKNKKVAPIYLDLSYVPHHGNSYYAYVDFFKRVRARYYVFSGIEPSREVYNALLEAKQTWEDKELEVTIIPTYDTDTLGYWVADNEELLAKYKIDLSPSASRCTINLQDHETSCSAYRLEF